MAKKSKAQKPEATKDLEPKDVKGGNKVAVHEISITKLDDKSTAGL